MTAPKGKFNYFDWLLFTQVHETFNTNPRSRKRMNELCDIINSCLDEMAVSGYDPEKVFNARYEDKGKTVRAIVKKYRATWEKVQMEEASRRNR